MESNGVQQIVQLSIQDRLARRPTRPGQVSNAALVVAVYRLLSQLAGCPTASAPSNSRATGHIDVVSTETYSGFRSWTAALGRDLLPPGHRIGMQSSIRGNTAGVRWPEHLVHEVAQHAP